jgi:type IV pilus assembly protein PilC
VARGSPNPRLTRMLTDIRSDVETGTSLSGAFRKHPLQFDALYCNLVEAGEAAGILETLLERLAHYQEKTIELQNKIRSALIYPISVLVVAFIVVAVIMIFVIPSFKDIFKSFGADLPAPTLVVIAMSEFFVEYWLLIFGGLGFGIYMLIQSWRRSPKLQMTMDRVMLKLPIFGPLIHKAAVARWSRTLSTMFAAGVPLVEALDSVGGAAGNAVFSAATEQIQRDVATGSGLTSSMQASGVFPNMVLQMSAIGEESGSLDQMLSKVADFYEQEVDEAVKGLSTLMEPIIIVVLGTIIGGIVVSMYLPIFKLGQVV